MRRFKWKTRSVAIALFLLLIVVSNPELRAFLLVFDFMGADVGLLLLGAYLNHSRLAIALFLRPLLVCVAWGVSAACKTLRWIAYGLHPSEGQWAHIDYIVLICRVIRQIALTPRRALSTL